LLEFDFLLKELVEVNQYMNLIFYLYNYEDSAEENKEIYIKKVG